MSRAAGRSGEGRRTRRTAASPSSVYLMMDMSLGYGRAILHGVRRYLTDEGLAWRLGTVRPEAVEKDGGFWSRVGADAVIGMFGGAAPLEAARRAGLRAVNVSARGAGLPVPSVIPDNPAIGRLAAEYFLNRGFRRFLFVGIGDHDYSEDRGRGFGERLAEKGLAAEAFPERAGERWTAALDRTLARLAAGAVPTGVLAANDQRALRLIEICVRKGVPVPEQAAILGVDNDDVNCELAPVPLSSVDPDAAGVGYRAAGLLRTMLTGRRVAPGTWIRIPPRGVITRPSTDLLAVSDPEVAALLGVIRERACEPVSVGEAVEGLGVSRRTLEKRFRAFLGRSPHEEIKRIQFERARRLIAETRLSVREVARQCGYRDTKRFSLDFRRRFGRAPQVERRSGIGD